eukprot:m.720024 g.720024  ORF g.720024 m.720024 type:complete len:254 (-) comp58817_c0_seq10:70-831(-)
MDGILQCLLGMNCLETEELTSGERALMTTVTALRSQRSSVRFASILLQALNQLGILWAGRSDHTLALTFLNEANEVYEAWNSTPYPVQYTCWFDVPTDNTAEGRSQAFENLHTHTLYYLAQCYGHLKQPQRSAEYCHLTLNRQLVSGQYSPGEWAINCACLSQYYLTNGQWSQASHCLAAAVKVSASIAEPTADDAQEQRQQQLADIALCWSKYYTNLLLASKALLDGEESSAPPSYMQSDVFSVFLHPDCTF